MGTSPTPAQPNPDTIDFAQVLARKRAKHFADSGAFPRSEVDDFVGDLILHLLHKWPKYNPARSSERGFTIVVFLAHSLTMLRKRRREQESSPTFVPLDESSEAHQTTRGIGIGTPIETLSNDEESRFTAETFAGLPPELDEAARALLLSEGSCAEAARILGLSRATMNRRRDHLRAIFAKHQEKS